MFSLTETVKEWLISKNTKSMSMHEEMSSKAESAAALDEYDNKKTLAQQLLEERVFHGTPVTPAVFAEWNIKFLAEMRAKSAVKVIDPDVKTGKQIFMEYEKTAQLAMNAANAMGDFDESLYENAAGDIEDNDD